MDRRTIDRITLFVSAFAVLMPLLAFGLGGVKLATAAVFGSTLGVGNWMAMRWIFGKLESGSVTKQAGLMVLLSTKMIVLGSLIAAIVWVGRADAIGIAMGFGAFVFGVLGGAATGVSPRTAEGG